jgi:hypothetical protein
MQFGAQPNGDDPSQIRVGQIIGAFDDTPTGAPLLRYILCFLIAGFQPFAGCLTYALSQVYRHAQFGLKR